jgi:hypothetical protein
VARLSSSELEQETEGPTPVSRQPVCSTGAHESGRESPFLGELLFAREVEAKPARTDLILRDSPFTAYEFDREEPIPNTAESQFVKEEKPDADVASRGEIDFAELEEESPFRDPEAEAAPESLLEAEGGITGTQPELYGESAPWLRKDEDDEFTEQEHRPPPKKVKVSDTFAIPFRWVCKIAVRKNGKYHHGGSGVLISDRQVLTAAHVVYDVFKDRAQYDLEVTPAQNGNDDLGTYAASGKPLILSDYEPAKTDYDYALITLNTSIGSKKFQKLNNDKLCF